MPAPFLLITAPAKVNLYLGVHTQKGERGYHQVDSVMTTIDLADTLAITPHEELVVRTVPEADFPMEENTAYRAAVAMGKAFGREPNFAILIDKHIPVRSGLGGPSTDAAAVIMALARFWEINPTDPKIDAVARSIGADVPFFLYGPPAHLVGFGDEMHELFRDADRMRLSHELIDELLTVIFVDVPGRSVKLVGPAGHGVELDFEGFGFLGVWTATSDSPFVAIEPWVGCATCYDESDVFEEKRGTITLAPGETCERSFSIRPF